MVAQWLLARTLRRADEREMVLGDLEEQSHERGRAWYWRSAIAIAAHALLRQIPERGAPGARGDFFMSTVINDIRYAARGLVKRPLLTLTVATTLALGLGANAAIFNTIDRLVLRPYAFDDPDHIVMLAETGPGLDYKKEAVSPANFLDWRRDAATLASLSAFGWWDANLAEHDEPERLQGAQVSASFFESLHIRPALGRGFVHDDEIFGRHHVVILSDALWKRRFDNDPSVIGRAIMIDGEPHQVIGVAPPRFAFPDGTDVWSPLALDSKGAGERGRRYLTVVGRLQPGRTLEEAQAEMELLADRLAREYPDANRDHGVRVYTLNRGMLDVGVGPMLSMWQASASVVLLIACANIANLLLARAAERKRETAVRLALGAARGRVIRELLTESVLLAVVAVPPALGVAWLSLRAMKVNMPPALIRFVPGFESLGVDFRLVAFTMALAVLTACAFGFLPALRGSRFRLSDALKEGGRSATGPQRLRRGIVVAQIAIALPLLVSAGLGVLGTQRFLNGPQGYQPDNVLSMLLVLPERAYPDDGARRRFYERALDAVTAIPDVQHAAIINSLPAAGSNSSRVIEIDGHPSPDPTNPTAVDNRVVTPDYFSVMRIPILRGRGLTPADREDSARVVVISESMARRYWPGEDPIGRRLKTRNEPWFTVVGISGDIIQDWYDRRNSPTMYRPIAQAPSDYFGLLVRTGADPAAAAGAVRQALLRIDRTQPVFDMMTMRERLYRRTVGLRYMAAIMSVFAGIALLLAAVGLYAVISYMVAQRRHEIGLRMALGASGADVMRLTVGQAFKLTLAGSAIGLLLSIALARFMEAGLLGAATSDARVFILFAAVLMGTAVLAGYLPARRAAAIDPMIALRTE